MIDRIDTLSNTPPYAADDRDTVSSAPESNTMATPVASPAALPTLQIRLSAETILYGVLILFALILRLADLGMIPYGANEAHEALAAYRAIEPEAVGNRIVARQPLMFSANTLLMSIAGSDDIMPRVATALLGVLIVFMPYLYRRWIGAGKAAILSVLFAVSPALLFSSRTMAGATWSLALVLLIGYFIGRYLETRSFTYGAALVSTAALLGLLSEPGGILFLLILAFGLFFMIRTSDDPDVALRSLNSDVIGGFPILRTALIAVAVIIVLGTAFFTRIGGLANIGESITALLTGFTIRPAYNPTAFPLLTSLFYEPALWLFGIAGAYSVLTDEIEDDLITSRVIGRILIGMLIAGAVMAIGYVGAGPDHSLWLTLPLAGLSAFAVEKIFAGFRDAFFNPPTWGRYLHAVITFAIAAIMGINLLAVGRFFIVPRGGTVIPSAAGDFIAIALALTVTLIGFLVVMAVLDTRTAWGWLLIGGVVTIVLVLRAVYVGDITSLQVNPDPSQPTKLLMVLLSTVLMVIIFFMAGSYWGAGTAWRGLALGLLVALTLYGLNNGWRGAVMTPDNAVELWRPNPSSYNLELVEQTLVDASRRTENSSRYDMEITVQLPASGVDDTPLLWALRRFHKANYVTQLSEAITTPAVVALQTEADPPLGAAYVGQDFGTSFVWDRTTMKIWDVLSWIFERGSRQPQVAVQRYVLWIRADVYGASVGSAESGNILSGIGGVQVP